MSASFVTLSSLSPTVTRSSSIALVILVPDGNTLRASTLLASVPLWDSVGLVFVTLATFHLPVAAGSCPASGWV